MNDTFDFKAVCTECGKESVGRLHIDDRMRVVDSDGGMLFGDGWMCHNCLGEPWSSADNVVAP